MHVGIFAVLVDIDLKKNSTKQMTEKGKEDWSCKVCFLPENESLHFYGGPDICDYCILKKSQDFYNILASEGHVCMRQLVFGAYMKVQWCGEVKCKSKDVFQIFHDTQEESRWHHVVQLTRMDYRTWLEIDELQRFATFREALEGYVCVKCQGRTMEKNPVFAHPSCGIFFCQQCVQKIRVEVVPLRGQIYSLRACK
jgi:hypothetical protein